MSDDAKTSDNPTEQVLGDLFQHLEALETQNAAILQFLKDKGIVTDKKFAPYLEQAAVASDVKWRAARVRMKHLFATRPQPAKPAETTAEQGPKKETKEVDHKDAGEERKDISRPDRKVADMRETAGQEKSAESGGSGRPDGEFKARGQVNKETRTTQAEVHGQKTIESREENADEVRKSAPTANERAVNGSQSNKKEDREGSQRMASGEPTEPAEPGEHAAVTPDKSGDKQVNPKDPARKDAA